ncbi:MAG TPA: diaminopimelate epimerase [Acidimicrobiales bacterium]|nr:diaminopimelate epimerase [Acidimicrobiales bacterium]
MPPLRLTKHHGQGNDFLVLLDPDDRCRVEPTAVRFVCDRRRGVGADGLIRVTRADPGGDGAVLTMELHNADGGTAEMSGNGIRCLAQAAVDEGLASPPTFVVRTVAGPRTVTVMPGPAAGTAEVTVDMGAAELGPEERHPSIETMLPDRGWRARTVCVGNPHLVLLGTDLDGVDVAGAGSALQDRYPGGINLELVTPGPGPDELVLRVWERGVGETLACGTGSCAAAAAAQAWGVVGDSVRVHNPGGVLEVGLDGTGVVLGGVVHRVCSVEVDIP